MDQQQDSKDVHVRSCDGIPSSILSQTTNARLYTTLGILHDGRSYRAELAYLFEQNEQGTSACSIKSSSQCDSLLVFTSLRSATSTMF